MRRSRMDSRVKRCGTAIVVVWPHGLEAGATRIRRQLTVDRRRRKRKTANPNRRAGRWELRRPAALPRGTAVAKPARSSRRSSIAFQPVTKGSTRSATSNSNNRGGRGRVPTQSFGIQAQSVGGHQSPCLPRRASSIASRIRPNGSIRSNDSAREPIRSANSGQSSRLASATASRLRPS